MNMKNNLMMRWLNRFFVGLFLLATMLLVSCDDDPEPANEVELITTFTLTLTPVAGGSPVTLTFTDLDGDGPNAPVLSYDPTAPGTAAALLAANTAYTGSIELLNESETPAEDVTEEIEEEDDEHLFCFTIGGGANIDYSYADEDDNGLEVGLITNWETFDASTGTITIVLRHQPGVKNGQCPGGGDTDIEVTFNIVIQ